jgi:NADH-quinone oxidoreductase subunit I
MGSHASEPTPAIAERKVLSHSEHNKGVRVIQVSRAPAGDATFLRALGKGLKITVSHFFRNVTTRRDIETVQYPEETVVYPERNRGLHRLMQREDGSARCVACMCCPTVCPAHCITIIPAETDDAGVEKAPAVFEIDELRCVVCGMCEQSCPCDAIRMDTGTHARPVEHRADAIESLATMLSRGSQSTAVQGGGGADYRDRQPDVDIAPRHKPA